MNKKWLALASMISLLGLYGCDSDNDISECGEEFTPVCLQENGNIQLRCGKNGMVYHQMCSQGCVTDPVRGSICKGEEFCDPVCEVGYYCDYDTCKPGEKPQEQPVVSQCNPACGINEVCVNQKCRIPGTCDTKADCSSNQDCIHGYCVIVQENDNCTVNGCQNGQICDAATGNCIPVQEPECSNERPCTAEGMTCDLGTGKCIPETKDCKIDGCPDGYECNETTNLCDPVTNPELECSSEKPCTEDGMTCDLEQGKCVPETKDCKTDGCPDGFECNETTNLCDPVVIPEPECSSDMPCTEDGMTCDLEKGRCVPETKDCKSEGCPLGYKCNETSNQCAPEATTCTEDKDCPNNGHCNPITKTCRLQPEIKECGVLTITDDANTCEKTGSGSVVVLRGDVLALDKTYKGGMVAVENGKITYVGCGDDFDIGDATVITCPNAAISPGFINGHEHLTYSNGKPGSWGDERFDHRYDWRKGANGHKKVPGGQTGSNEVVEVRALMAGTTSIFGSGSVSGLTRNLDTQNIDGVKSIYQTFPLADSSKNYSGVSSCADYDYHKSVLNFNDGCPYGPHIAEGINQGALNELRCLNGQGINDDTGSHDIFKSNTAIIHGIAATPDIVSMMAQNNVKLIWSPRTNISLYGDTAQVTLYDTLGVTIGLGTDWIYSGSANMLREFTCIDSLNKNYYNSYFSDYDLWKMPTYNNAVAFGLEGSLGQLKAGLHADIVVIKPKDPEKSMVTLHRAVIEAQNKDVSLVMLGGNFMFGDANIMPKGDDVDVCGSAKKINVNGNGGSYSYADVSKSAQYDLFFCDTPKDEPTCTPMRTRDADTTNQQTTMYTGSTSDADDSDGDGIPDKDDNCPTIFNPIRPQNTDRVQADYDKDGIGDVCDPYPTCVTNDDTCPVFNTNDRDNDGIDNLADNCPDIANPGQEDEDEDGIGDACDKCDNRYDNDNDGLPDNCDACPDDGNNEDGNGCSLQLSKIADIRDSFVEGSFAEGLVKTQGIVTAVATKYDGSAKTGFFLQDPEKEAGIFVYSYDFAPEVAVGDLVEVRGPMISYYSLVEIKPTKTSGAVTVISHDHSVTPKHLTAAQTTEETSEENSLNRYDSVLVTVQNLTVASYDTSIKNGDHYICKDQNQTEAYLDDYIMGSDPFKALIEIGETYDVTGILVYDFKRSKIAPRSADDLYSGLRAKTLTGVEDAGWGSTVALTVGMSEAVEVATTVTLSCDAGSCPDSVVVEAGQSSATFNVTMPESGNMTITATYDGKSITKTITGNDGAEAAIQSMDPATLSLLPGGSENVTVTFDRAVKADGTLNLTASEGLTVPATVNVAAGSTTATFSVAASTDIAIGSNYKVSVAFNDGTAVDLPVEIISSKTYKETFDDISGNSTSYENKEFTNSTTGIHWSYTGGRLNLKNNSVDYAIDGNGIMFKAGSMTTTLTEGIGTIKMQTRKAMSGSNARTVSIKIGDEQVCDTFTLDNAVADVQDFPLCTINRSGEVTLTIVFAGDQKVIDNIEWTTH